MEDKVTIKLTQRGVMVLPKQIRETYNLSPGDYLTFIDLGGVFVLSPKPSEVDALADRISRALQDQGETLESMLHTIREERLKYSEDDPGIP